MSVAAVDARTVEEVVRHQLSTALGGRRGMAEGAIPTVGFTLIYVISSELALSIAVGAAMAVVALVIRVAQR